jgi:RES domain-containing protein
VPRLDLPLTAYRIGNPDGEYSIIDASGSRLYPGRWNTAETPVIYASEHYSTAMLEKLVHASGRMPPNQHYVEITFPKGVSCETLDRDSLPGWDEEEPDTARAFGTRWARECRTLLLLVPSLVARIESNVVINPLHAEFEKIRTAPPVPIWWDKRLFQR